MHCAVAAAETEGALPLLENRAAKTDGGIQWAGKCTKLRARLHKMRSRRGEKGPPAQKGITQ